MKKLIVIALAALYPAIAHAQADQAGQAPEAVRVTGAPERVSLPPQLHNVWYDTFDAVAGDYALSNGGRMSLTMWGNRMYARIGSGERIQLVAVSPYVFVGRAQQMKIVVDDPDTGSGNRIHATVLLPKQMLSSTAAPGAFVSLLASR